MFKCRQNSPWPGQARRAVPQWQRLRASFRGRDKTGQDPGHFRILVRTDGAHFQRDRRKKIIHLLILIPRVPPFFQSIERINA